jgi:ribosome-associated protein
MTNPLRVAASDAPRRRRISGRHHCCVRPQQELTVIHITDTTEFDENEIAERFVRSAGSGNKNINRAATAVEARLDINRSALPFDVKERLIAIGGKHVTDDGVLIVVSRADPSQARNRDTARARLLTLVKRASIAPKERTPTTISAAIRHERLIAKERRSELKRARSGSDDS